TSSLCCLAEARTRDTLRDSHVFYPTELPDQVFNQPFGKPQQQLGKVKICYHTFWDCSLAVLSGGKYTTPFHFRKLFFQKNKFIPHFTFLTKIQFNFTDKSAPQQTTDNRKLEFPKLPPRH